MGNGPEQDEGNEPECRLRRGQAVFALGFDREIAMHLKSLNINTLLAFLKNEKVG